MLWKHGVEPPPFVPSNTAALQLFVGLLNGIIDSPCGAWWGMGMTIGLDGRGFGCAIASD